MGFKPENSVQLELMFGLVELEFRYFFNLNFFFRGVVLIIFFVFYLVWLMLDCIPKMGFITCLEVP